MSTLLKIGTRQSGVGPDEFTMPAEAVTKAAAIVGIRESGKSTLGTVMAEEYCKARQPWIALDPVGNWWGLRAPAPGYHKGYPVVVFGGERGDLPLERGDGRKIAEAVTAENVFAVIDLKRTSKTVWRTLVRDLVGTLLEIQPAIPRKIFLEESAEFVPQKPSMQLGLECAEIVERLVTLGGNWGYGVDMLGQRPADISKKALTQCETVFAFATQGERDRKAITGWMDSQAVDAEARQALAHLADLETGSCFVWSPRFLKTFGKIKVRERETFHPRDARRLGMATGDVELAPVEEFVTKVRRQLTKTTVSVPETKAPSRKTIPPQRETDPGQHETDAPPARQLHDQSLEIARLKRDLELAQHDVGRLNEELINERGKTRDLERRLEAIRARLRPEYDNLRTLFEDLGQASPAGGAADPGVWEPWLAKAGKKGCRRMLEILIERSELTRAQLGTLAGVSPRGGTFSTYLSWLSTNGLIEKDGEKIRLRAV